ncbi:hypothetical protein [Paludisphaera mucosa]|uniref:Uncharacterized protein n=1 Tax=Paludisphaera mucosa TaxID=3030827 RepID=A0ABT6F426_9BACT|nr:hypothetical protein [Paludisphaera mucosa]MDG3002304.1 hypothetical protein [Paludisphaera mucosa]
MDEFLLSLVAAGNTFNPSLIALRAKGYSLRIEVVDDGGSNLWCASKDGRRFAGYSPPELLGLVALWEHLGDDWNRQTPDILSELFDDPS